MSNKEKINWTVVIIAFLFLGFVFYFWRVGNAGATVQIEQNVCFCHNVNNNPHTICTSNQGLINGHLGHVNNGLDYVGACVVTPTPTATATPTSTPTPSPTPTLSPTATPTVQASPTASPSASPSPTASPTSTPESTPNAKDPPEKSDPCFYIPCATPAATFPATTLANTGSNKEAAYLLITGLGAILFSFGLRKLIK